MVTPLEWTKTPPENGDTRSGPDDWLKYVRERLVTDLNGDLVEAPPPAAEHGLENQSAAISDDAIMLPLDSGGAATKDTKLSALERLGFKPLVAGESSPDTGERAGPPKDTFAIVKSLARELRRLQPARGEIPEKSRLFTESFLRLRAGGCRLPHDSRPTELIEHGRLAQLPASGTA